MKNALNRAGKQTEGLLTAGEERELAARVQSSQDLDAVNQLLARNIRLVKKIAGEYSGFGVEFEDLEQAGMLGLRKAVMRYNPVRNTRLSTYAYPWIREAVRDELRNFSRAYSVPREVVDNLQKYKRLDARRQSGEESAAAALGVGVDDIRHALTYAAQTLSLDAGATGEEEEGLLLGNSVGDESALPAWQECAAREESRTVRQALSKLTDKEAKCVAMKFGLNNERESTLEEIGRVLGCSREWVRKIIEQAMDKLRLAMPEMEFAAAAA